MHRFAGFVFAAIMTGCACTGVGCGNAVEFMLAHDLERGVHYDIELCVGGHCLATRLMVKEREGWVVAADERVSIDTERDAVTLRLSDQDYAGTHDVSLVIADESGRRVVEYEESREMVSSGGWPCGPTCWNLTLDVPAVARP